MSVKTFTENNHLVLALPPVDINGGFSSDVWSMKHWAHCTIIVQFGVVHDSANGTITVKECDDFTPTNSTAIAFNYRLEDTAGGDTLGSLTAATSSGLVVKSGEDIGITDNKYLAIEIDARELSDGYPNLQIVCSDPGQSVIAGVLVILSNYRYVNNTDATVIA